MTHLSESHVERLKSGCGIRGVPVKVPPNSWFEIDGEWMHYVGEEPMSLRNLSWRERGAHDFTAGILREEGPFPAQTPEGQDWLAGYNEALAAASDETLVAILEMLDVQITVAGDRLVLTDTKGRSIGTQAHISIEQESGAKTVNATVTFVGLKLVPAPKD